jgi:hypothetical protein
MNAPWIELIIRFSTVVGTSSLPIFSSRIAQLEARLRQVVAL